MPHLKAYPQALAGLSPLGLSTRQPRLGRDQPHRLDGIRVCLCRHHLLVLLLRSLGLRAPAGISLVGVTLSHRPRRGARPRAALQLWDRCHPLLPTGWMRSGLLPRLKPSRKSPYGKDPHPLIHNQSGGRMIARSLSPQAARTLLLIETTLSEATRLCEKGAPKAGRGHRVSRLTDPLLTWITLLFHPLLPDSQGR